MTTDKYSVVADVFRDVPQRRNTSNIAQCWSEFVDYEKSRRFVDVKERDARAALRRVEITLQQMSDAPKGVRRRHAERLAEIAEEKHPRELLQAVMRWARDVRAIASARSGASKEAGDPKIRATPAVDRRGGS